MWEVMTGLLVGSLVGGLVPVVNAEAIVVVTTLATSAAAIPLIAVIATTGQMIAKLGLFMTARWAPSRLPPRAHAALERGREVIGRYPRAVHAIVFVSAVVGLPPFYAVSLAAGALGTAVLPFLILGTAGRALRFTFVAWAASRFGEAALGLLG